MLVLKCRNRINSPSKHQSTRICIGGNSVALMDIFVIAELVPFAIYQALGLSPGECALAGAPEQRKAAYVLGSACVAYKNAICGGRYD